ncbi:MAG: hypothetical protein GX568_03730 [Candidatus Gastranaerophilales bacterium]|nr:hypothetical protein [Candidatus Gastranaerophilales bacterium]
MKFNPVYQEQKIKYLDRKDKTDISNSITKNWTDQAMRCYLSGCNCMECSVAKGNYSFVCQMPAVIEILLKQVGPPEQNKINKMTA